MTDIVDLTLGDDQSSLIILRECEQLRRLLLTRLHDSFERISSDVLPVLTESSRLLHQAAERNWSSEYLDHALLEVTGLEAVCRRVERLIRCYQDILTAAPALASSPGCNDARVGGSPETRTDQR